MTLLIAAFAAVVTTLIWYTCKPARELHIGTLSLMYWGASLMWFVDAVAEYLELQAAYFTSAAAEMQNDAFLGASVIVFGLVIWMVSVLIRDPKHLIADMLLNRHEKS